MNGNGDAEVVKRSWVSTRIVESLVIAVLTAVLTSLTTSVILTARIEERVDGVKAIATQRGMDMERQQAAFDRRVDRVEERFVETERQISRDLQAVRESIGRLEAMLGVPTSRGRR